MDIVGTGDAAVRAALDGPLDLIILDINLPVLSGFEVCRILREGMPTARVPIIMLTARAEETDRVSGLDLGAGDYATKPFSLRKLAARARAVMRRGGATASVRQPESSAVRYLSVDFDAVSVIGDSTPVHLTGREYGVLCYLLEHRNRVVSRDHLLHRVSTSDACAPSLGPPAHVETVLGFGYRVVDLPGKGTGPCSTRPLRRHGASNASFSRCPA